jgi:hypothetical protein
VALPAASRREPRESRAEPHVAAELQDQLHSLRLGALHNRLDPVELALGDADPDLVLVPTPRAPGSSLSISRTRAQVNTSRSRSMTAPGTSASGAAKITVSTTPGPGSLPPPERAAGVAPGNYGTHRAPIKCEKAPKGLFVVAGAGFEPATSGL